jgi:hypothetical protein
LRQELATLGQTVQNPRWRGFAALSLFVTTNEGQIAGVTGGAVTAILREHGVTGKYLGIDGGRTSRGNFRFVRDLMSSVPVEVLTEMSDAEFDALARRWEARLIERFVRPALLSDPIIVRNQHGCDAADVVRGVLDAATPRSLAGPVAQHLVGAKLQRRHKDIEIENHACFAQDSSLQRNADFTVHKYAFHVTVAPKKALVRRWEQNVEDGLMARVLVRDEQVETTRRLLASSSARRITVLGIETFVGQNVDEMATDEAADSATVLADVFAIYNRRVAAVERDATGMEIQVQSS